MDKIESLIDALVTAAEARERARTEGGTPLKQARERFHEARVALRRAIRETEPSEPVTHSGPVSPPSYKRLKG